MRVLLRGPPLALLVAGLLLCACVGDPTTVDTGPIALTIVGGNEQVWIAGHELPDPLVVKATTMRRGRERPLRDHLVNFRVLTGGGSVYAGASITDQDGIAQEYWTLGAEPGENVLEVRSVDPTSGEKQAHARFTAAARPWPEELTAVRSLVSDAFVLALVGRLDPGIGNGLLSAFDEVVAGLGEELDFDAAEAALARAHGLVSGGGPPNLVEFVFLDLVLGHTVTLFHDGMQAIDLPTATQGETNE